MYQKISMPLGNFKALCKLRDSGLHSQVFTEIICFALKSEKRVAIGAVKNFLCYLYSANKNIAIQLFTDWVKANKFMLKLVRHSSGAIFITHIDVNLDKPVQLTMNI